VVLIFSEICYGLGMCFIYGALEGWITQTIGQEFPNEPIKNNYFGHLRAEINGLTSLVAGPLGMGLVLMTSKGFTVLYVIGAILMMVFFILYYRIPYYKKVCFKRDRVDYSKHFKQVFTGMQNMLKTSDGIAFFLVSSSLTAIYQTIFHYWQPFFTDLAKKNNKLFWTENELIMLGIVFFSYSAMRFILNKFVREKMLYKYSPFSIAIVSAIISAGLIILLTLSSGMNIIFYILIFAGLQGTTYLIDIISETQFLKKLPEQSISSCLSVISTLNRLLGIGVLSALALYVNAMNLPFFFLANSIFYLLIVFILVYWRKNYDDNK
jgi:hypothetical protein